MRHLGRNRSGQAYSLTVLAPILPGHADDLAGHLDTLAGLHASPLARVPGTHFARWVVIDDVVYEGPPQKRDHLSAPRLLFTSNFDGELAPYLEGMRTGMGTDADAIWSHCAGYPGHEDDAAWAPWFDAHQIDSSLFFGAYGDRTVQQVLGSLDARSKLRQFALDHRGTPAAELQTRFLEVFGT